MKMLILSLLCLLTSCQAPSSKSHIPRINIGSDPQTLDPRKAISLNDVNITKFFFEGLTKINDQDAPELAAAKSYTLSDDGKTYTFILRPSRWSNGDPVTAHDFVRSYQSSLSPEFSSATAYQLYIIKNAKSSSNIGVKALDDATLVIELNRPIPYFLELISRPIFFPIHQTLDPTISNGPFYLKNWHHQSHIEACKNAYYWDKGAIKLNGIKLEMLSEDTAFNLFEQGELDWDGSPFSSISPEATSFLKSSNQLKSHPFLGTVFIRFNTAHPTLQSNQMRKAMAWAINREELIDHVLQGNQRPALSLLPHQIGLNKFEVTGSEKAGLPATIKLTYFAKARNQKLAQALQQQWKKTLNINVDLEPLELKVFFDQVSKGNYQLALGDWIADFADPINFLEVFKKKRLSTNRTYWENAEFCQLLDQSDLEFDQTKRKELLSKAEKILIQEMPIIPLYEHSMLYIQNEKLKNVTINSMGTLNLKNAYLEK